MTRSWLPRTLGPLLLAVACGPGPPAESASGTSADPGTASEPPTGGPGSTSAGCGSQCPDVGGGGPCDVLAQDCPEGQKCSPVSSDIEPHCVPVVANPLALGASCEGTPDGDPCEKAAACWDVWPIGEGPGKCMPLCDGAGEGCTAANACGDYFEASAGLQYGFGLCLPTCDPLAPVCGPGEECTTFFVAKMPITCVPDIVDRPPGSACSASGECADGSLCGPPDPLCGQEGSGCCVPFCDTTAPACPPGMECAPPYGPPQVGLEHVGVCRTP